MFKVLNNTMSSYISHLECFFLSRHISTRKKILQYKSPLFYGALSTDPGVMTKICAVADHDSV